MFAGSRTGSSGREPRPGAGAGRALAHRVINMGVAVIKALLTGLMISYIGKMRGSEQQEHQGAPEAGGARSPPV